MPPSACANPRTTKAAASRRTSARPCRPSSTARNSSANPAYCASARSVSCRARRASRPGVQAGLALDFGADRGDRGDQGPERRQLQHPHAQHGRQRDGQPRGPGTDLAAGGPVRGAARREERQPQQPDGGDGAAAGHDHHLRPGLDAPPGQRGERQQRERPPAQQRVGGAHERRARTRGRGRGGAPAPPAARASCGGDRRCRRRGQLEVVEDEIPGAGIRGAGSAGRCTGTRPRARRSSRER